jgi:hypothetical protein
VSEHVMHYLELATYLCPACRGKSGSVKMRRAKSTGEMMGVFTDTKNKPLMPADVPGWEMRHLTNHRRVRA